MQSSSDFEDSSCLLDVGCIVNNWKIVAFVDQGGFGKIFMAHDINNEKDKVIIKTESTPGRNYLEIEAQIYQQLSGKKGFPRLFWSGVSQFEKVFKGEKRTLNCRILVLELLGLSLSSMFSQLNHKFTLKTVLLLSLQMIDRIETLHDVGVLHRDIKPSNFVLNKSGNVLYLLDFGLSEFYFKSGEHIAYKENIDFKGTHKFASVNALKKIQQSRRDDLVSLAYNLIYFLNGLPWYEMKVDRKNRRVIYGEIKSNTPSSELTKGLPSCFQKLLDYSLNLDFFARPDYDSLRKLFKQCLKDRKINEDLRLEWEETKSKSSRSSPKGAKLLDPQNLCTNLLLKHLLAQQRNEKESANRGSEESHRPTKKMKYSPPSTCNTPTSNASPTYLPRDLISTTSPYSPLSFSSSSFASPAFKSTTTTTRRAPISNLEPFPLQLDAKILDNPTPALSFPESPLASPSPKSTLIPPLIEQINEESPLISTSILEPTNAEPLPPIHYNVKIPQDFKIRITIDKLAKVMIQLRTGIYLEQLLKERQRENPLFAFLFEPTSDLGLYYQWRVYSLLNNDSLQSWRTQPFQMFVNGPIWHPPPLTNDSKSVKL